MNGKWPATLTAETLERLSDEEFWRYAHELASQAPGETPPLEYLKCELGYGHYLIPLTALYEVVPAPHQFALLPSMPTWMPGVFAWHGQILAVVDLDAYLLANASQPVNDHAWSSSSGSGLINEAPTWTLLVANHSGLPVGLLVPASSLTMTTGKGDQEQSEAFVLDLPIVLTELVQQIKDSCSP
jgi:chemotaxis signal transduction protein